MNAERWKRVEQLLQSALDLPSDEHEAFFRRTCAGDASLERDVRVRDGMVEVGPLTHPPSLGTSR